MCVCVFRRVGNRSEVEDKGIPFKEKVKIPRKVEEES